MNKKEIKTNSSVNKNLLVQNIKNTAKEKQIKNVLIGISGGADSTALLRILYEADFKVCALHVNYNLRGEESIRDRDFVVKLCNSLQIPLKIKEFNTKEILKGKKGISLETLCRELRYDWFFEESKIVGADRIVTAHNADDNIETFFLNFCRGAGTSGLKGMQEDTGIIWRPLIKIHRQEIIDFLKSRNQKFCLDSSNIQTDYRRNFIRNKILPLLRNEWKGFDKSADKVLSNLYYENKIIEKAISNILEACKEKLPLDIILDFEAPELLVRRFISNLAPYSTTANEILDSIRAGLPKTPRWVLPKGTVMIKKRALWKIDNK